MTKGIRINKVWSDDDVVELSIVVSDGASSVTNQVYVGHEHLARTASDLNTFKRHIHGGLLDVRFGEFGPEYANGAFHARFHFPKQGRLFISCDQESDFTEFSMKTVASRATVYLQSESALLDRFIAELTDLAAGSVDHAFLEAV